MAIDTGLASRDKARPPLRPAAAARSPDTHTHTRTFFCWRCHWSSSLAGPVSSSAKAALLMVAAVATGVTCATESMVDRCQASSPRKDEGREREGESAGSRGAAEEECGTRESEREKVRAAVVAGGGLATAALIHCRGREAKDKLQRGRHNEGNCTAGRAARSHEESAEGGARAARGGGVWRGAAQRGLPPWERARGNKAKHRAKGPNGQRARARSFAPPRRPAPASPPSPAAGPLPAAPRAGSPLRSVPGERERERGRERGGAGGGGRAMRKTNEPWVLRPQ